MDYKDFLNIKSLLQNNKHYEIMIEDKKIYGEQEEKKEEKRRRLEKQIPIS